MYTICETVPRWARCSGLRTVYFALRTIHFALSTLRYERRPVAISTSSASHSLPHTSSVGPSQFHTSHLSQVLTASARRIQFLTHLERRPVAYNSSHLERRNPYIAPHASHLERRPVATNDCSGKHAVSSGTQSSGPGAMAALGPL